MADGSTERDENAAKPTDAPQLSYTIGRLDRAVTQRLRVILEPFELTLSQFTTLSVLNRRPGLSNAQLARRALILPQSMIQVMASLEKRQLVDREPDRDHNRVLRTHLTPEGRTLVTRAERETHAFEAELIAAAGDGPPVADVVAVMQRWLHHLSGV